MNRVVRAGAGVRTVALTRTKVRHNQASNLLPRNVEALQQSNCSRVLSRIWVKKEKNSTFKELWHEMDYAFAETEIGLHVKILILTVVNFVKVCSTGVYFYHAP